MIAALVWKEYREQRIAWAALAVVGAATLFGLPIIMEPGGLQDESQARDWIIAAIVLVAWAYGVICGAMLLAGEREMRTLAFLDALPGLRGQLWRAKCLAGVLLVIAQVAVLMGLAAAARLFPTWTETAAALIGMAGAALFGLAWGMLFSSFGRSVMNMILLSLAGQLAAVFVFTLPAAILSELIAHFFDLPPEFTMNWSWTAVAAFSVPAALGASALIFTRPDRGRLRLTRPPASIRTGRIPRPWGRLIWLTLRQSRLFTAGLVLFSALLGFLVLANGLILWPALTLLVGVLCGATAFADEQQGPFRFLGDQRFPLGRFWIVKVGYRLLLAVAAALLVLLPSFIRVMTAPEHNGPPLGSGLLLHVLGSGLVLFLILWLVCGFCSGCLSGLLFRNGLAAGVFALGWAILLAGVSDPVAPGRRPELLAAARPAAPAAGVHSALAAAVGGGPHRVVDHGFPAGPVRRPRRAVDRLRAVLSGIGGPGRCCEVRRGRVPRRDAQAGRQPGGRAGARRLRSVRQPADEARRRAAGLPGDRRACGATATGDVPPL